MAIHGLKNIALAVSLLVIGSASQAQPVPPRLPTRPAPVSGKVAADPAAVMLHPASGSPVLATSTATQVSPPANPNEPLLRPEAEQAATAHLAQAAPSAVHGEPHLTHTEGKTVPATSKGIKKVGKMPGHAHADKTGARHHKKKAAEGKAEKAARVRAELPHGGTAKHAVAKHHAKPKQQGKADKVKHKKPHHTAHHAKAASAPTVSTAHELKADAHAKHGVKKAERKLATHHAKAEHKPAVKPKKKAAPTHAPA